MIGFYVNEVPPETVDGIRTEFSTRNPIEPGTATGYVRGLQPRADDTVLGWTENTHSITFLVPPPSGDPVIIRYSPRG